MNWMRFNGLLILALGLLFAFKDTKTVEKVIDFGLIFVGCLELADSNSWEDIGRKD